MSLPRSLAITLIAAWWTFGCTRPSLPTPTASAPAVPSPTASVTAAVIETPTAEMPEPPTPVPATPAPASLAIAHLSPGAHLVVSWIQMVDAATGWATGARGDAADHVTRTADGGVTWSDVTPPEEAPAPDAPKTALGFALDGLHAWVVFSPLGGYPTPLAPVVWRTTDGGSTWLPSVPLATEGLSEMFAPDRFFFLDETHGWLMVALGAGMSHEYIALFRTVDGGLTWERLLDPYGIYIQSFSKTGMAFADADYGWVTRDSHGVQPGIILDITEDGGLTWEERTFQPPEPAAAFFDEWACGAHSPVFFGSQSGLFGLTCLSYQDFKTSKSYIYRTNDRGMTWAIVPSPDGDLRFLNPNEGWAFGPTIDWTEDSGLTWEAVKQVSWVGQFSFVDRQRGWAVARSDTAIALVSTTNGGTSWQEVHPVIGP